MERLTHQCMLRNTALCYAVLCCLSRLRKDPLDPIDSGTKVQILFNRLTDPEFARREEEAKKKQVGEDHWLEQL